MDLLSLAIPCGKNKAFDGTVNGVKYQAIVKNDPINDLLMLKSANSNTFGANSN